MTFRLQTEPPVDDDVILLIGNGSAHGMRARARALTSLAQTRAVAVAEASRALASCQPAVVIVDGDAEGSTQILSEAALRHPTAVRIVVGDVTARDADGATILPRHIDEHTLRGVCGVALQCVAARRAAPSDRSADDAVTIAIPRDGATLAHLEREIFLKTLSITGGNQRRAAHLLGLRESTFRFRLRKLSIERARMRV